MRDGSNRSEDRGTTLAAYIANSGQRTLPPAVIDAAKIALVDHVGVALGGAGEQAAVGARKLAEDWNLPGRAVVLTGHRTRAAMAAFVNGIAAHAMDFDDTHPEGAGHISSPVWATALALASDLNRDEDAAIRAFVTGYEVMARLGGGGTSGVGKALQEHGFHPTSVFGVVGATAAACSLLELDETRTGHALGLAATSAGGLVISFGTDAKPYHAGRAAWNGILAAELAARDVSGSTRAFETESGLLPAFVQSRNVTIPELSFEHWELLRNGYKPYACCRAAHASILAAQKIAPRIAGRGIRRVRAKVHWSAQFTAGIACPETPLEAKFSLAYCIAAALSGYEMSLDDFELPRMRSPALVDLLDCIEILPIRDQPQKEAHLEVLFESGEMKISSVDCFLGHPDNPMTPEQMDAKFMDMATRKLGDSAATSLLLALRSFERPGSLLLFNDICATH